MTATVDKFGVSDNNNQFINKINIDSVSVCLIIINVLTIFILSCGVFNSIVCTTLCMSCYMQSDTLYTVYSYHSF